MSDPTATCGVTVLNRQGLHARPAHMLVEAASRYACEVEVIKGNEAVDGKSILSVLTLGAECGTELTIRASGPDADEAVRVIAEMFARKFRKEGSSEEE